MKILKEYCNGQQASQKYTPTLLDIFKIWSFAAETRNESLLTNVPAILAQLLKLISTYLEFRDFGLSLCETLLYQDQVQLLERGLNAPAHKPHLTSPCLRLLTEVVSFDGGAVAADVFEKRDVLFKRLESLLKERENKSTDEGEIDRTKPTLRSNAVRFVIANLQYQDAEVKSDLVLQGRLLHAALRGIENDHPDTVQLFLQAITKSVVDDAQIKVSIKSKFLNAANLTSISKLLEYESELGDMSTYIMIRGLAQELLMKICLQPKYGLMQFAKHHPSHSAKVRRIVRSDLDTIDLGVDSPFFDENINGPPSMNDQLAVFVRSLQPERHLTHSKILRAIFASSPDVLADYFNHKSKFKAAVKDESEWRAEFAFLFQIVRMPAEDLLQKDTGSAPHESVLIEHILPLPLTQATLTKWINSNDEIVSMSASRMIAGALEKLQIVLKRLATVNNNDSYQTVIMLKQLFLQRCPAVAQLEAAAARGPKSNENLRHDLNQCLATFLTTFPEQSRAVRFEITKPLTESLQKLLQEDLTAESRALVVNQVRRLLKLADRIADTRWWQATGMLLVLFQLFRSNETTETGGPTTCNLMLRVLISTDTRDRFFWRLARTLKMILLEKGIIYSSDSFHALVASFGGNENESSSSEIVTFLDSCMHRIVHKPIRYLDMLENAQQETSDFRPLNLLACCVAEQWPHLVKRSEKKGVMDIAKWIARFFRVLEEVQENLGVMEQLQHDMMEIEDEVARDALQKAFATYKQELASEIPTEEQEIPRADGPTRSDTSAPAPSTVNLATYFPSPPPIPPSISGLDRWTLSNLTASDFSTHQLPSLFRLLTSQDPELRTLAFHSLTSLHHLLSTVSTATLHSAAQFHLLTGELLETIKSLRHTTSTTVNPQLPSVLPELASLISQLLPHPTDPTYPKLSRFLLKSPSWNTAKILTYWSTQFLLRAPAENNSLSIVNGTSMNGDEKTNPDDTAHALEVDRFLQMLADGIRTGEDLDMYRRQGVWERCFALGLARDSRSDMKIKKGVLTLVYRALKIEGGVGREMLIRRAGVGGWLRVVEGRLGAGVEDDEEVREMRDAVGQLRKMVDLGSAGDADADGNRNAGGDDEEDGTVDPVREWRERLPVFHMKKSGAAHTTTNTANGIGDNEQGVEDDDEEDAERGDA